jgi:hypothetical protein
LFVCITNIRTHIHTCIMHMHNVSVTLRHKYYQISESVVKDWEDEGVTVTVKKVRCLDVVHMPESRYIHIYVHVVAPGYRRKHTHYRRLVRCMPCGQTCSQDSSLQLWPVHRTHRQTCIHIYTHTIQLSDPQQQAQQRMQQQVQRTTRARPLTIPSAYPPASGIHTPTYSRSPSGSSTPTAASPIISPALVPWQAPNSLVHPLGAGTNLFHVPVAHAPSQNSHIYAQSPVGMPPTGQMMAPSRQILHQSSQLFPQSGQMLPQGGQTGTPNMVMSQNAAPFMFAPSQGQRHLYQP